MVMQEVVVQGVTVEDAMKQAMHLLGAKQEEIQIQVLNPGSSGVAGLGRRPAVVRAWKKKESEKPSDGDSQSITASDHEEQTGPLANPESLNATAEGSISLARVEHGEIILECSKGEPYPIVVPCPEINLWVNGIQRTEPVVLMKEDVTRLEAVNEEREGRWYLQVSEDGMKVVLRLRPKLHIIREIVDLLPSNYLHLKIKEKIEKLPPVSLEAIIQDLTRQGVIFGIDWEACARAAVSSHEEEIVIARGRPPVPGEDARIEIIFSPDEKSPVITGGVGRVDYRERFAFTSVDAGTIVARKYPGAPGVPGTNVRGELIAPPSPKDVVLKAGKGVALVNNGFEAVALNTGRPLLLQNEKFSEITIYPGLVHSGDVDLSSGNIAFKGDVLIGGNVNEGMNVDALGNVRVAGHVAQAMIKASGSILVQGNVLSSVLVAGGESAFIQELTPLIDNIHKQLQLLLRAIDQLQGNQAFKTGDLKGGIGPLLKLLLEIKFKNFPQMVKLLKDLSRNLPEQITGEKLSVLARSLEYAFITAPLYVRDCRELNALEEAIDDLKDDLTSFPEQKSDILLRHALNSNIRATGNVKVVGTGCYNTRIVAGGIVKVEQSYRGGEIQAGGNVYVGELGARSGIRAQIKVPGERKISLGHVYENSIVQVGDRQFRFDRKESGITVSLDQEGNLKFAS